MTTDTVLTWQDIHSTTLVVDGLDCSIPSRGYVERLRAAGVGCMHLSVEDMDNRGGVHPFNFVYNRCDELGGALRVARTVREIHSAREANSIAIVLGWQGADPPGVEPGTLRAYYELGLRVIGITYNTANRYGGGCLTPTVGLTDEGRALVDEANRLGMLLDLGGHTGEEASIEAIARSEGRPVISSHTGVAGINPNRRNSSERLCEAIAGTGGVIGVVAVNDFLVRHPGNSSIPVTPQAPLSALVGHLERLRRLVGPDHIGLGPDFVEGLDPHGERPWPGQRFFPDMISEKATITYVQGFESIDQLPTLTSALIENGWPAADIRKLLGENWLRVYRAAWGE